MLLHGLAPLEDLDAVVGKPDQAVHFEFELHDVENVVDREALQLYGAPAVL